MGWFGKRNEKEDEGMWLDGEFYEGSKPIVCVDVAEEARKRKLANEASEYDFRYEELHSPEAKERLDREAAEYARRMDEKAAHLASPKYKVKEAWRRKNLRKLEKGLSLSSD